MKNLATAIQMEIAYATLHSLFGDWLASREAFAARWTVWSAR